MEPNSVTFSGGLTSSTLLSDLESKVIAKHWTWIYFGIKSHVITHAIKASYYPATIQTPNSDQVKKKEDLEYNHNKGWSVTKLLKKGRARIQP